MDDFGAYRGAATDLRRSLDRLEAQWVRLGAPIADLTQPGISQEQVDALSEPYGVTLPPELKVLWNWHDGVVTQPMNDWGLRDIGPGHYQFLSCAEALDGLARNLQIHPVSPAPAVDPEAYWHSTWIPFMHEGPQRLCIDTTRVASQGQSPVRLVEHDWDDYDRDRALSLSHAVLTWIWVLEHDYCRWNPAAGIWDNDQDGMPEFVRYTGLA